MAYLDPTEYLAYGLTAETTDDWVRWRPRSSKRTAAAPALLVTQYVERMRLTAGSQAVRLSYLPQRRWRPPHRRWSASASATAARAAARWTNGSHARAGRRGPSAIPGSWSTRSTSPPSTSIL